MPTKKNRTQPGTLATGRMNKREATVLSKFALQCQTFTYDFDTDGGAVGEISFGVRLPANSYVTDCYADSQTAPDSAGDGASIEVKAGATSLTAAEGEAEFDPGPNRVTLADPDGVKLSDSEELKVEISGEDLTAGKLTFAIYFHTSE